MVAIRFRRNYGQTAAFSAGFDHARGRVIITLDADRQNDPADIPALLAELDKGYDVVNGWRQTRQDDLVRRFPSRVANRLIARTSGVRLRDRGCSLRAFRHEVVEDMNLYGELHRFIPELVNFAGFTMSEVPVNHRARVAGPSQVAGRVPDRAGYPDSAVAGSVFAPRGARDRGAAYFRRGSWSTGSPGRFRARL